MSVRRIIIFVFFALLPILAAAQQSRTAIDSMQYVLREYRSSVRHDIRDYRDSIRNVRRHTNGEMPHEVSIGWGDQAFESLIWRQQEHPTILPPEYTSIYNEDFCYTQHWFFEYRYRINYWYSFGFLVDYSGVFWNQVERDGQGTELARLENRYFHNIIAMPVVRCSYFQHDYTSLYSAIGLGVNVNTGTEIDYKGRTTAVAPAVNITLIGLRVGKGRWYGAVELGGMFSLGGINEIYMLGSRLFTLSAGVKL